MVSPIGFPFYPSYLDPTSVDYISLAADIQHEVFAYYVVGYDIIGYYVIGCDIIGYDIMGYDVIGYDVMGYYVIGYYCHALTCFPLTGCFSFPNNSWISLCESHSVQVSDYMQISKA